MTQNLDNYDEKYMKMKFVSDDNLPLNKTTEIPIVTIAIRTEKYMKILKSSMKMEKTVIAFDDIEIQKQYHQHKRPFSIKNIDIKKVVVVKQQYLIKQWQ